MCGIAGIVRQDKSPVERMTLERMVRAMVHRGPDDQGIWMDRSVGLGHRRLSIIDRSSGHQPLCNEDESVWIAFNGEIYNYQEIREELLANGHTFRTKSDTEVIVHLVRGSGRGVRPAPAWDVCIRDLGPSYRDTSACAGSNGDQATLLCLDAESFRVCLRNQTSVDPQRNSAVAELPGAGDYLTHRYTTAPRPAWQRHFEAGTWPSPDDT